MGYMSLLLTLLLLVQVSSAVRTRACSKQSLAPAWHPQQLKELNSAIGLQCELGRLRRDSAIARVCLLINRSFTSCSLEANTSPPGRCMAEPHLVAMQCTGGQGGPKGSACTDVLRPQTPPAPAELHLLSAPLLCSGG